MRKSKNRYDQEYFMFSGRGFPPKYALEQDKRVARCFERLLGSDCFDDWLHSRFVLVCCTHKNRPLHLIVGHLSYHHDLRILIYFLQQTYRLTEALNQIKRRGIKLGVNSR